jgi:hypothetical protein
MHPGIDSALNILIAAAAGGLIVLAGLKWWTTR